MSCHIVLLRHLTFFLLLGLFFCAHAEPNLNGETGYINMPSARIAADGTLGFGYSYASPYMPMWSSITVLPRLELSARYTRIMNGAVGAPGTYWGGYGDYKDKALSGKLLVSQEDRSFPALAFGINDVQGTGLFSAKYLAASKQFSAWETTLGYGTGRISGMFAGSRYAPADWQGWGLAAEYDANNYRQDIFALQTGVAQRKKGLHGALEYRWNWLGGQLGERDGKPIANIYVQIPLEKREFIPKIDEPVADSEYAERPSLSVWNSHPEYQRALLERLLAQDFRAIHIKASAGLIEITLTNTRISLPSRAVGRAARSVLLRMPLDTHEIKIHYTRNDLPFATYRFFDLGRLRDYFDGEISRKQLARYVSISYALPQSASLSDSDEELNASYVQTRLDDEDGGLMSLRRDSAGLDKLRIAPGMGVYFNDPSGAFRYETFMQIAAQKQAAQGLFLKAASQLTINQNVSGVTQLSNSLLPHVRTDVADYKKNGNFKLTQALANQYFHPAQRVYMRASAGLYEEMFGGFGGQILYYPSHPSWAADLSVDALKQRDPGNGINFRSYSTVSTMAAVHYQLPFYGITATLRAGRFLAKDWGTRFEMKRHFLSGFEIGAWYTLTNGNDITTPGTPTHPYRDKGVFIVIPLNAMLTKDTEAAPTLAISPWTRDVGQMVASPGDLYQLLEPAYRNLHDQDGLSYFGDLDDRY
jgi:hypothetical protein